MIGKKLAHFEVTAKLGEGGMGEVYRAIDTKLGRDVAIKVLPTAMAGDPERLERFKREAQTVAALNHPNIVTIHSVEVAGNVHLLTMELVDGKTLDQVIPSGGLPLHRLFDLAIPMADALAAAHASGITHRDLKPANVMVTSEERIKILDFGLAKVAATADSDAEATMALTQDGMVVGTVRYMSPEQARGEAADPRSDVFSLGVLLFEMATGSRPFQGKSSLELLSSILKDNPPSVTELREELPKHLARIIRRCLEKDPARRYQTAGDVRNELEDLRRESDFAGLAAEHSSSGSRPRAGNRQWLWAAVVLALVALVGFWVLRERGATPAGEPKSVSDSSLRVRRMTNSGQADSAGISADGRLVAYVLDDGRSQSLRMLQIETGSDLEILPPGAERLSQPTLSPDGNYVYFARRQPDQPSGDLYRISSLGGAVERVVENAWSAPAFSPDGRQIAFGRPLAGFAEQAIVVSTLRGENQRELTRGEGVAYLRANRAPSWSPDGSRLAIIAATASPRVEERIATIAVAGGPLELLDHEPWKYSVQTEWLPSGRELVAIGGDLTAPQQIWTVSYPEGFRRRLTTDSDRYFYLSAARETRSLVAIRRQRQREVWLTGETTADWQPFPGSRGEIEGGNRLAWVSASRLAFSSGRGGTIGLWAADIVEGTRQRLAEGGVSPARCGASEIVFVSLADSHPLQILKMSATGGEASQLTSEGLYTDPVCTPDGRWLLYRSSLWQGGLGRQPLAGGESEALFTGDSGRGAGTLALSPDGRRVVFSVLDPKDNRPKAAILPIEGGGEPVLYDIPPDPITWAPNGLALDYARTENGVSNVWRMPLDGGEPSQLTNFDTLQIHAIAWSPDGSRLAVTRGQDSSDVILIEGF